MRLAVVTLAHAPYWEPLFVRLSRTPGVDLRVFLLQDRDSLRGWATLRPAYPAVQVPCLTPEWLYPLPVAGVLNRGLAAALSGFRPDCLVLHGYSYLSYLQAAPWARAAGVPYLLWGDSNAHTRRGPLPALKKAWLESLCRSAAGVLVIGASSREFWGRYGVGPERQYWSPLAVDNDFFAGETRVWRARREEVRRQLGLPEGRLLLYAGRLLAFKNVAGLYRALARASDLGLAVVGDGPESAHLDRLARHLGLSRVFRFGFQPQSELPKFYAAADALALPSLYEPWGLVANEAMAAGLPVLVARTAGCRPDLVEEGVNGFSFDAASVDDMTACLDQFSRLDDAALARMGARSQAIISRWTMEQTLAGLHEAVAAATAGRDSVPCAAPGRAALPRA